MIKSIKLLKERTLLQTFGLDLKFVDKKSIKLLKGFIEYKEAEFNYVLGLEPPLDINHEEMQNWKCNSNSKLWIDKVNKMHSQNSLYKFQDKYLRNPHNQIDFNCKYICIFNENQKSIKNLSGCCLSSLYCENNKSKYNWITTNNILNLTAMKEARDILIEIGIIN